MYDDCSFFSLGLGLLKKRKLQDENFNLDDFSDLSSVELEDFEAFWNFDVEAEYSVRSEDSKNIIICPEEIRVNRKKGKSAPQKRNRTTELLHATVHALKKYYAKYPPPAKVSSMPAKPNKKVKVMKENAACEKKVSSSLDIIDKANLILDILLKDGYSLEDLNSCSCLSVGSSVSIPSLDPLIILTGGVFCGSGVVPNFVSKDSYTEAVGAASILQQAALLRSALLGSCGTSAGSKCMGRVGSLPTKVQDSYLLSREYSLEGTDFSVPSLIAVVDDKGPGSAISKDRNKCCLPFKLRSVGLHPSRDDCEDELQVDGLIHLKLENNRILNACIWFDSTTVFEQLSRFNGN